MGLDLLDFCLLKRQFMLCNFIDAGGCVPAECGLEGCLNTSAVS